MLCQNMALAIIMTAVASLFSMPAAHANDWQGVQKAGVLMVGIEGNDPPFDFLDANRQPTGFDVDLARAIADKLGVKARFVPHRRTALVSGLNAGAFDVIIANSSTTQERAKSVDFTIAYNVTHAVLVCRQGDAKYHKLADLNGARVGVGIGTSFAALAKSVKGAHVVLYDDMATSLQDLANGRLDAVIYGKDVSTYVTRTHDYPLTICSDVLDKKNPDRIAMAVTKGNKSLLDRLDKAIETYTTSAAYTALYNKWLGPGTPPLVTWKQAQAKKQ